MGRDDEERISRFLGEFRMLVTAVGVLVAFDLQAAFSSPFLESDATLQIVHLIGTLAAVAAFACFLIPASIHRLASQVHNADHFITLARYAIGIGFVFLAIALVLGIWVMTTRTFDDASAAGAAGITAAILLGAWIVVPRVFRARGRRED